MAERPFGVVAWELSEQVCHGSGSIDCTRSASTPIFLELV